MTSLILVWGIRRSGNNVVRNWIASQFDDVYNGINLYAPGLMNIETLSGEGWANAIGKHWERPNKVLSFEDHPLQTVDWDYEQVLGKYDNVKKVVILRDPYNTFASRIKYYNLMSSAGTWINKETTIRFWEHYAEFFVKKPNGVILVSYNRFVSDKGYRQELSKKLGGTFNDSTIEKVDDNGKGSSFDGVLFDGKAGEMRVFNRWEVYKDNEAFRALFTKKIMGFAKEIFNFDPPW